MNYFGRAARVLLGAGLTLMSVRGAGPLEKLNPIHRAPIDQDVAFEVYLPLQNTEALDRLLTAQHTPGSSSYRKWLTPEDFNKNFGPSSDHMARTINVLQAYGFKVTRTHSQGLRVEGKTNSVESAFAVSLYSAKTSAGAERLMTSEPVSLPSALSGTGAQIVHFSPVARKEVNSHLLRKLPDNRYSPFGPYWSTDLKQAYQFPSYKALTGKGRTIAIVMASDFRDKDIAAYFAHEKLAPPRIARRRIFGGAPFDPKSGASFEAELDLEQAGGMAPGAKLILYNIPDLFDDSILGAYLDIVIENRADIVSSSFGGSEGLYTAAYSGVDQTGILRVFHQLFKQGNAQGITFVASSGDSGALDLLPPAYFFDPPRKPPVVVGDYEVGIQTPASDPNVTAVGGTTVLETTHNGSTLDSAYVRESAFSDQLAPRDPRDYGNLVAGGYFGPGGGESIVFQKPAYQQLVQTGSRMRTIPDVSLLCGGCPAGAVNCNPDDSSVALAFDGGLYAVIGTSVSAPGFAGLLALEEEHLGGTRLGNVNFQIYAQSALQESGGSPYRFFHQKIPGFNGHFSTHPGYDLVTGNGTPIGINFIFAPGVPAAGTPQTPTNP